MRVEARALIDAAIQESGFRHEIFHVDGSDHYALYHALVERLAATLTARDAAHALHLEGH